MAIDADGVTSDSFGAPGSVPGASGPDSLDSTEDRVKTGLSSGVSITNAAFSLAGNLGSNVGAAGPIGAGIALGLQTCVTAYESHQDLSNTYGQIAILNELLNKYEHNAAARDETRGIVRWQIHKFKRRNNYNKAGSANYGAVKSSIKGSWSTGTKAGKGAAVAKGVAFGAAAAPMAVAGQVGSKTMRLGRGFLKKTGLMGSQRKGYAADLYGYAKDGCPLAKEVVILVMTKGLTDRGKLNDIQAKIDKVMTTELAKAMSSYAGS